MHTGSIDGMSALIGPIPIGDSAYVLANLDHAELRHALMYRVFDMYSGNPSRDWSKELLALYGGLERQADSSRRQQEQRRVADTRPSLPLERYAGTYTNATYGNAVLTVRDGALHFAFGKGRRHAVALALRHVPGAVGRRADGPVAHRLRPRRDRRRELGARVRHHVHARCCVSMTS